MRPLTRLRMGVIAVITVFSVPHEGGAADGRPPKGATRATAAALAQSGTERDNDEPTRMRAQSGRDLFAGKTWKIATPTPPPPAAAKPVAPPLPFVFVGSMRDAGSTGETLLFVAQGDRHFIVRTGETIGGTYRLDALTEITATFTYLPLQEQQRLSIGNTR